MKQVSAMMFLAWMSLGVSAGDTAIFKWRDAQGRVHYGEEPVPGFDFERLEQEQLPQLNMQPPPAAIEPRRRYSTARRRGRRTGARADSVCARYRVQIALIERELRLGYTEPRGAALHKRKRQLSSALYSQCY